MSVFNLKRNKETVTTSMCRTYLLQIFMSNRSNDLENLRLVSADITLHAHLQTFFLAKQIKKLNCSASDISTFFKRKEQGIKKNPAHLVFTLNRPFGVIINILGGLKGKSFGKTSLP